MRAHVYTPRNDENNKYEIRNIVAERKKDTTLAPLKFRS